MNIADTEAVIYRAQTLFDPDLWNVNYLLGTDRGVG